MGSKLQLAGLKFNRLTAVRETGSRNGTSVVWECLCDCGKTAMVGAAELHRGHVKSCGCLSADSTCARTFIHGGTGSSEYRIWLAMKQRCNNPKNHAYDYYGGRGIGVCERWTLFENFLSDMGKRPSGQTLERIENSKGYSPDNCRWATRIEQSANMRSNVSISHHGKTQTISQWSRELGICHETIRGRIKRGWTTERILEAVA